MKCNHSQEQLSELKELMFDPKLALQENDSKWYHKIPIPILYINFEKVR